MSAPTTCLHIRVDSSSAELACSTAWDLGATAISEQDTLAGELLIAGFVDDETTMRAAEEMETRWTTEVVAVDPGVQDSWKEFAEPIHVGQRILLEPAWLPAESWPTKVVIRLDSERVFGSGTHPTTRLCLESLEDLVRGGERVLDLGAGSGVLGICAIKLGAQSVSMVDIDADAAEVIEQNVGANNIADQLESFHEHLDDTDGMFDLIVANILIGPLVELAPMMLDRLQVGGHLVVSGLWGSQWRRLLLHLDDVTLLARTHDEGWSCLLLQRDDKPLDDEAQI